MSRLSRGAGQRSGGHRTAVVKANYVKTAEASASRRISASVEYYGQDKNIDGSYAGDLEAFDHEHDDLGKEDTSAFHEENFGEHPYLYRVTLSPGTDLGPDEMRDFVRDAMSDLGAIRGQEIDYQAYVHDDHEHPHAHVVFYQDTTLRKGELNEWRHDATVHAQELEQRYHQQDLELDQNEPEQHYHQEHPELDQNEPKQHHHQQDLGLGQNELEHHQQDLEKDQTEIYIKNNTWFDRTLEREREWPEHTLSKEREIEQRELERSRDRDLSY